MLHFATSAHVNSLNPLFSWIDLAPSGDEDGRLDVYETFGLRLNASLVTLSACETGRSDVQTGDELLGLIRGFFYAGTSDVIASLWKVDDSATQKLMSLFYTHLTTENLPLTQALQKAKTALQRLAAQDSLTRIANRRRFDEQFHLEWRRALREFRPVAIIMCDIDYFKSYNDCYGHVKGDDALRNVAQAIDAALKRPMDLAARYGGEEFAVLLPNTDIQGATRLAGELQQAVGALRIEHAGSLAAETITLSFGVAAGIPRGAMQPKELIEAADRALYQAKQLGRNRMVRWRLHSDAIEAL